MDAVPGRTFGAHVPESLVDGAFVPLRRDDVFEIDLGDGVVLYDPDPSLVHHLNPSAAEIWRLCDGRRTAAAITTHLAKTHGGGVDPVEEQVAVALGRLETLGLVKDVSVARQHTEFAEASPPQ
jgi:pyrroloquinoline quinone biosynthesis protein D